MLSITGQSFQSVTFYLGHFVCLLSYTEENDLLLSSNFTFAGTETLFADLGHFPVLAVQVN